MSRARRIIVAVIIILVILGLLPRSAVRGTSALYSAGTTSSAQQFAGATFSPSVAPLVSHSPRGQDEVLSWAPVSVSNGLTVTYVVTRIRLGISTVVCTGANAPVLTAGSMTCTDKKPGTGALTYTEQPVVIRSGQTTWSLPASAPN